MPDPGLTLARLRSADGSGYLKSSVSVYRRFAAWIISEDASASITAPTSAQAQVRDLGPPEIYLCMSGSSGINKATVASSFSGVPPSSSSPKMAPKWLKSNLYHVPVTRTHRRRTQRSFASSRPDSLRRDRFRSTRSGIRLRPVPAEDLEHAQPGQAVPQCAF